MGKIFDTILGTVKGLNDEGSSKRATAFWFTVVLLTSLIGMYEYCFYIAAAAISPTTVQTMIVKMFPQTNYSLLFTLCLLLGLTTFELALKLITKLIEIIRGGKSSSDDKKETNAS